MTAVPKTTGHSLKKLLPLFAALSLADLLLTCWLLRRPTGEFYEANPVARWWLMQFGWAGLAGFKAVVVLLVACLCGLIARRRPQAARRVLGFGCAVSAVVVLYSVALYNSRARADEVAQLELARLPLARKVGHAAQRPPVYLARLSRLAQRDLAILRGPARAADAEPNTAGADKQAERPAGGSTDGKASLTWKPIPRFRGVDKNLDRPRPVLRSGL
jgi:hypothetical protein